MERGVNDIQVGLLLDDFFVNHHRLHCLQIIPVHLTADGDDEFGVLTELHVSHLHFVHLVDDAGVVRREHLTAVFPICFVAVVFFGVVRSGHVYATLRFELTDSKRNLGRRTEALEEIYLDAVGGKHVSYGLSKQTAVVAAVMSHHYSYLVVLQVLETTLALHFQQVVGKTLRGHCYYVFVHSVGTHAHDSAEATRSKFKIAIESLYERSLVVCFHHCFYLCLRLSIVEVAKPKLRFRHYGI